MAIKSKRWYASLTAVKDELGIAAATTTYDAMLKRYIERASQWVEDHCHRIFIPLTATRYYDCVGSDYLYLDEDLLAVTTLTNGDADVLVDGTDFYKYPLNSPPYWRLDIKTDSGASFTYANTLQKAISLLGRWGYSEDYEDTTTTLGAAITSATVTTFTSSNGALLEVGWTLLVDSEQMFCSAISSNTITVVRAMGGTTGATHLISVAVYRYAPETTVEQAVIMLASCWYNWRKDSGVRSKTISDYSVTYDSGWPIPDMVTQMLSSVMNLGRRGCIQP